jgi:hypothetical protein
VFKKLTYKQKSVAQFGGFLLFLLVAYNFSVTRTLELRKDITEKSQKIDWLREKEEEIPFLKAKIASIERSYNSNDSSSVRDKLTAFISDFSETHQCTVTDIPVCKVYKKDNMTMETNFFTVSGRYHELLKLQHEVETKFRYITKLRSVRFFSIKEINTKRKKLFMTITAQSINKT